MFSHQSVQTSVTSTARNLPPKWITFALPSISLECLQLDASYLVHAQVVHSDDKLTIKGNVVRVIQPRCLMGFIVMLHLLHSCCYPHMPIGKVWIYWLLFSVCFFVFVLLRISPPRIKLAVSHFARWFIGVLGREYPILGNFAAPEAQNRMNWPATGRLFSFCVTWLWTWHGLSVRVYIHPSTESFFDFNNI